LWLYDDATEVLLAKPLQQHQPGQPLQVRFTDQVELVGFDLSPVIDDAFYVSLYWRALKPFEHDYTVFVHLRDEANTNVATADHQPYNGLVPTSRWPVDGVVKETIRFNLPADLADGSYRLLVGLYAPDTAERLPIEGDTSGENAVHLADMPLP
jgi:hypothetical protein